MRQQQPSPPRAPHQCDVLSSEGRRQQWEEQQAAARRNRAAVKDQENSTLAVFLGVPRADADDGGSPSGAKDGTPTGADYYERKAARLQAEQAARDAEHAAFQAQHWREVREAAQRNRRRVMADLGHAQMSPPHHQHQRERYKQQEQELVLQQQQQQQQQEQQVTGSKGDDDDDDDDPTTGEFAAMLKDMQDVVGLEQRGDSAGPSSRASPGSEPRMSSGGNGEEACDLLAGRFVLNGKVVPLPVQEGDPLGVKVEALRVYLDQALGSDRFLKVYRRLESLTAEDDENQVSLEFVRVLGEERLPYLALVHQLIVCEEQWEAGVVQSTATLA